MARRASEFQTIRSEGGLLPPDLLRRVLDPKEKPDGTRPEDYGLPPDERLNEVITQSWNRLRKHWAEFRTTAAKLPEGEPGTGLTNDKWSSPLLRELGFGLLPTTAASTVGGRTYAINRFFGPVPVHLVGCGLSLDHRAAGVRGAAAANPHGLVQEFVNRSTAHVWAIVCNGLRFRILRDNQALSRQSFLEFDLEAMFVGEVYSDFVLLWLVAHATRFAPREADTCWLEQWTKLANEQGTRALGDLRGGVERALQTLGEGLTSHQKNTPLRDALRTGQVPLADFHGQLLRVVYRLIFLFVAEDRTLDGQSLLHPRDGSEGSRLARERYAAHYSTARLRELASNIKGSRHGDLWRQFQLLLGPLSGDALFAAARDHLALPALGSFLWDPSSTGMLNDAELTNHDFLEALRDLAFTRQGKVLRPVDYKNLGAEELGGVYESLLALTPQISADGARFSFAEFAGNERKTSGSYYTPDSLVQCLLDSALVPVVEEAIKGKTGADAEKAVLSLKICDPAVGSGHFLVGAAHRVAGHLARVRALAHGESEPSPLLYQHALRDVIGRCLYGVDVNPMAAELCRVSLWLEALEPGKPLSFLDHHIRVGNSLLGATPELIAAGIPDEAFTAIEGDDKKACAVLKKRNKTERAGLGPLFAEQDAETQARLQHAAAELDALPDDRPEEIRAKELAFRCHEETEEYRRKKHLADAWCAAFIIRKQFSEPGRESSASGITQGHLNGLADGRPLSAEVETEVGVLSDQYQIFHWHLSFPEVFAKGGFDCILGNPPWERVKLQEQEFFASRNDAIASAPNAAARKNLIAALAATNPLLWSEWCAASRAAEGQSNFVRQSGRYPLCGKGDVNTYTLFAEHNRAALGPTGRAGFIVPTGIATDDTTKEYFGDLMSRRNLAAFYGFENEGKLFKGIDHRVNFCLLILSNRETRAPSFSAFIREPSILRDPDRVYQLTAADIESLNPNTRTCPVFRTRRDADLTLALYRRAGVLWRENDLRGNPWELQFLRMFDMANDSGLFYTRAKLETEGHELVGRHYKTPDGVYLPLFEAKMVYHFNHRFGDFALVEPGEHDHILPQASEVQLSNPNYFNSPRYWVELRQALSRTSQVWTAEWFLGWRDVTDPRSSVRTVVACVIPKAGVSGKFPLMLSPRRDLWLLYASLCSFVLDYAGRQKIGGVSLSMFIMKQLPVLPPTIYAADTPWSPRIVIQDWLLPRVLELTYTAWDLQPFAQHCGWSEPPFHWDEDRRFLLRCELDAAFFHFYLGPESEWRLQPEALTKAFSTPRDAVSYIMDTFPIVKRKDEERFNGDYRTKRVILEIYGAMTDSIRTGRPYQTRLDPPPGDPRCRHPAREEKVAIGEK